MASFKIKFDEVPADGFNMVVRTWTQGDKWVTVKPEARQRESDRHGDGE